MDTGEALALARELLDQYELFDWTPVLDTRPVRRYGQCRYGKQEIGLSVKYVELNDRAEVEDTIRHEVAHALAGFQAHHGPAWRLQARAIGANPSRVAHGAVAPPAPLALVCNQCGYSEPRFRRPRRGLTYQHRTDGGIMEIRKGR
jgi:predicted SprT family Zn-dependent metalloprotease